MERRIILLGHVGNDKSVIAGRILARNSKVYETLGTDTGDKKDTTTKRSMRSLLLFDQKIYIKSLMFSDINTKYPRYFQK